jgi:hypothetical protein
VYIYIYIYIYKGLYISINDIYAVHLLEGLHSSSFDAPKEGLSYEGNVPVRNTIKSSLTVGTVLDQGWSNHVGLSARATKLFTVPPNILG